jgi:hypothetical protein
VAIETSDGSPYILAIKDVSDSLHFKTLVVDISWSGDSDIPTDAFFECGKDSSSMLFAIQRLDSLYRKDETTFAGFESDRDELVAAGEHDYPFTVSLEDHEVKVVQPDVQYIGYTSKALAPIQGMRMSPQSGLVAYTIKKGTPLTVDTLYRARHLVRLIVRDSIVVQVNTDDLSEKLQGNPAG